MLTNLLSFDSVFENIKQVIMDFQSLNDKLQILGEAEIDQSKVKETRSLLQEIARVSSECREAMTKMEKMSRGVEQRNKTRKLKELATKENDRYLAIQKAIFAESTEAIKIQLREAPSRVINPLVASNNPKVEIFYEKYNESGNIEQKGLLGQKEEQLIAVEHVEWHNQLIKENQEDLDHVQTRAHILNQLVQDLAVEVDKQDGHFEIITEQMVKTKENIIGAQKELVKAAETQKSGTKKYICIFGCAALTLTLMILFIVYI